jgi:hypothetical protein
VVVLLTGVNVPAGFWTTEHPWILVLVAVWVGGSVFVGAARREGLEAGARVELRVMDVIKTTLVGVAPLAHLELTQLTVRVFVVRRRWRDLLGTPVLRCAASLTLRLQPPLRSNVRWTRGKGVVGLCWDDAEQGRGGLLGLDTQELAGIAATAAEAEWAQLTPKERAGLSQAEARRLGHYGVVIAYPIYDSEQRFRGCLVVEGPPGTLQQLTGDDIADYLYQQQRLVWGTLVGGARL